MTSDLFSRKGRFTVTRDFLHDISDDLLFQMFSDVIVLRSEDSLWNATVTYMAVSPAFEALAEGTIISEYTAEVYLTEEGTHLISWRKK